MGHLNNNMQPKLLQQLKSIEALNRKIVEQKTAVKKIDAKHAKVMDGKKKKLAELQAEIANVTEKEENLRNEIDKVDKKLKEEQALFEVKKAELEKAERCKQEIAKVRQATEKLKADIAAAKVGLMVQKNVMDEMRSKTAGIVAETEGAKADLKVVDEEREMLEKRGGDVAYLVSFSFRLLRLLQASLCCIPLWYTQIQHPIAFSLLDKFSSHHRTARRVGS